MKNKLILFWVVAFLSTTSLLALSPSQSEWKEMSEFHEIMSTTFHPAEEGNLKPLKEKSYLLVEKARKWLKSNIPSEFKVKETKDALSQLVVECIDLDKAVKDRVNDKKLIHLITKAHHTFHKISGECKK